MARPASPSATSLAPVVPTRLLGADCEIEGVTDSLRYAFIVGGIQAIEEREADKVSVVFEGLDEVAWLFGIVHLEYFGHLSLHIHGGANSLQSTTSRASENK